MAKREPLTPSLFPIINHRVHRYVQIPVVMAALCHRGSSVERIEVHKLYLTTYSCLSTNYVRSIVDKVQTLSTLVF